MKILAIHPGAGLPSARIRVIQMAPYLEQLGARVECVEYPDGFHARRKLAARMRDHDVVLVHYRLPTWLDGVLWQGRKGPLVFDFDDAIAFRQKPKNGSFNSSTRTIRFARIKRCADAFSCGNRYLESLVSSAAKPVHITPTPVPIDVPVHATNANGPVRIGWIGGRGNLDSLEALGGVFAKLAATRDVVLVVISDARPAITGVPLEVIPWSENEQETELARLDIGVMPLEDNPWNRGKCAYKLLQYMAAAVPVVGSPVGMNAELVDAGENGLLADGEEEWLAALTRLVDDAELRRRLGDAGRETVAPAYGYEMIAGGLAAFFEALLRAHRS